ncbi:MAG: oxygen-dependent coproporphyrinogen oxidase [Bacteroidota bacterium]|nr:oxygen-dependent coproporphyrinogen oxidase [Bacteroidota bacterium]MDP4211585.1 oxygen-dependent coproporphyrinogen oxidase [Bacteroidota bacterium]MDP4249108.1 oxygen-dependent coproporphyrinogen oxidase [Bacteroidota bacterium]
MDAPLLNKTTTKEFRSRWIEYIYGLQDTICAALGKLDGKAVFKTDDWERAAGKGGGGRTRVMDMGAVIEKAGVNTSVVFGQVTDAMRKQLQMDGDSWFACGLSLVIHPLNPYVPTVHANWRFFELYDGGGYIKDRWFGGGADLTPYYLFEEDARHFHGTLKKALDSFDPDLYPRYKKNCDDYFSNTHRDKETRGIGGIFYDHLRPGSEAHAEDLFRFQQLNGDTFLEAYLPIVQKRKDNPYGEKETFWQEIRRGRYVEFNLIHDRGTLFGLKTKGRIESILMSLPPRARWVYDHHPDPGSREDELLQVCLKPKEWV